MTVIEHTAARRWADDSNLQTLCKSCNSGKRDR